MSCQSRLQQFSFHVAVLQKPPTSPGQKRQPCIRAELSGNMDDAVGVARRSMSRNKARAASLSDLPPVLPVGCQSSQ